MTQRLKAVSTASKPKEVVSYGAAHFAMIEKHALKNIDDLMQTDMQAARLVLSLIRLLEPGSGGVIVISRQGISEMLNVSMPTVQRSLKTLVEGCWVRRIRIGGAYALAINQDVAWVGPRGELSHAVFQATVVAARSEQDDAAMSTKPLKQIPMAQPHEEIIAVGQEPNPPHQPELDGIQPPVARTKPKNRGS